MRLFIFSLELIAYHFAVDKWCLISVFLSVFSFWLYGIPFKIYLLHAFEIFNFVDVGYWFFYSFFIDFIVVFLVQQRSITFNMMVIIVVNNVIWGFWYHILDVDIDGDAMGSVFLNFFMVVFGEEFVVIF